MRQARDAVKKRKGPTVEGSGLPDFGGATVLLPLVQEPIDKKLIDFLRSPHRLPIDDQGRDGFIAAENDQFFLVIGVLADVFLNDPIADPEIGDAIQYAL
jgi:hypothetical protein